MKNIVVIPARLESSRLPQKVLLDLDGKSILQRVYEQCSKAEAIDAVYIATDSTDIQNACKHFTDNIIMTASTHTSGTDRIAEAVSSLDCDNIINVQGDEPFIEPSLISKIAKAIENPNTVMASAMHRIHTAADLMNPNVVKVVVNKDNQALYFSRSIIPHHRDGWETLTEHHETIPDALHFYRHIGIYGYSKEFLLKFSKMEQSYLERVERLEQLRVLESTHSIQMITVEYDAFGIDTQDDYEKAKQRIRNTK